MSILYQETRTPAIYTKVSCFLPWIAKQFDLDYIEEENEISMVKCTQGSGNTSDYNSDNCRSALIGEKPCIFPFYWNGKLKEQCSFLEEQEFLFPMFRCPVRNITRKIQGINSFIYADVIQQVCWKKNSSK